MTEKNPFNEMKVNQPATEVMPQAEPAKQKSPSRAPAIPARSRRRPVVLLVVALAFLTGFLPMWLKAGRHAGERDAARHEVKLAQLEMVVAAAALDARRGEYELARQSASWFFTTVRGELDLGTHSSLTTAQQDALKLLFDQRDALITLLARSDPASEERLTGLYLACRNSLRGG